MKKLPSRAQDKALRESLDPDQLSPLLQPRSVRNPPLSPKTEYQLKQACAALGRDPKPSGQGLNPPPQRPQQTKEEVHARSASDPKQSDSNATLNEFNSLAPSKFSYKPDADLRDLLGEPTGDAQPASANISRRREPVAVSADGPRPKERQKSSTSSKPIDIRSKSSTRTEPDDTATSTPHTGSSDMLWTSSTAPTSEAITPARSSKRGSNQHVLNEQEVTSRADEAAAEWLRMEKEKRRAQEGRKDGQDRPQPATAPERPPSRARSTSRARSIKEAVQSYIRPGAPPGSRSNSRESFRSLKSDRRSSPSGWRWRSWSLTRNKSTRQESRPTSRDGRSGNRDENSRGRTTTKPEINLNRELPPLPSLDTWQEPEPEPATPSTHIASLMRHNVDSQHPRSRPVAGASSRSTPLSPVESSDNKTQSSYKHAHSRNNSAHLQSPLSPHPPRTSSRQKSDDVTRHTPTSAHTQSSPTSAPLGVPRAKSPIASNPSAPTASTKSRAQSIVSRLRGTSQSSVKAPSIPSASSRPGTSVQTRPSNELEIAGREPKQSVDANRTVWSNQPWSTEEMYTLTQTNTVGPVSGPSVPVHRSAEKVAANGHESNDKVTGLRKPNTTGVTHPSTATAGSPHDAQTHPPKISSDLKRDGFVTPWEYPIKGPQPSLHMDPQASQGRPRKGTDVTHGSDSTRLRSKFSRFFGSTGNQGGAKQKGRKGGEWVDTLDAVHSHARQASGDTSDRAAPPPAVRY